MLVAAFTRSLRDTFYHARVAALMALNGNQQIQYKLYLIVSFKATVDYYDAQECTSKVLPAISTVLIDKEK